MKTVVFDLDGTLADTSRDLIEAANACFEDRGHAAPLDVDADRLTAFHGGRAMLRLGHSRLNGGAEDADIDRDYHSFLERYETNLDLHTTLYDGAEAALARLGDAGYVLAVCTNKPEGLAEKLLVSLGVRDRFRAMLGADTLPVRKPDPLHLTETVRRAGGDPARSVLVGDTETDRETGRRAGVPVILVGFGPEGEGVSRLEPDAMIAHYDALFDEVCRLIG